MCGVSGLETYKNVKTAGLGVLNLVYGEEAAMRVAY